ncbi:DUF2383 domain-containing protein [Salipiger mangrovisoli]|uniref:DUF2383 domain-containing protein n=1 Tax=Salipiger mangrovisoli TaxID=2865933 RepID=A0ABR9X1G6_9RHOB|nr:DUF2383 domain-containing protein [Salipiger mangrovisoli]MBE9637405.1 DUF2383 domain-containing protein [Salipiger mangrovisoli]
MKDTTSDPKVVTASPRQLELLYHLQARSIGARGWFDEMVEKADPEFRFVAVRFHGLHVEQVQRLTALITAVGGDADPSDNLSAALKRASLSVRAVFGDIDGDMMSRIRESEAKVLAGFTEVIKAIEPSRYRDELVQMQAELQDLLRVVQGEERSLPENPKEE